MILVWEPCESADDGSRRWVAITQGRRSVALTVRTDASQGTIYDTIRCYWDGWRGQGTLWS